MTLSADLLGAILDRLPQYIHVVDAEGRCVYVNEQSARALGAPRSELLGRSLTGRVLGDGRGQASLQAILASDGAPQVERVEVIDEDGTRRTISTRRQRLPAALTGSPLVLTVANDLTPLLRAREEAGRHAMYDSLTGLPSRGLFLERVRHAVGALERRETRPFGVLVCDLDGYGEIADAVGPSEGAALLAQVARRLHDAVRPGDTVARFGGAAFAILLMDVGSASAARIVADRLHAALVEPFDAGGAPRRIAASVGIALAEHAELEGEALVQRADLAALRVRRAGGSATAVFGDLGED